MAFNNYIAFTMLLCRIALSCFFFGVFITHAQTTSKKDGKYTLALKHFLAHAPQSDSVESIIISKEAHVFDRYGLKIKASFNQTFIVLIPVEKMQSLLADSNILFADRYVTPKEELTTGILDLTVNKANTAHHHFPLIRGDSITVSVKENKFDTADIDFINRYHFTSQASSVVTAHASVMATTIGGGGNSSPSAKGVAYAALLTSANFASLLPESDALYAAHNITVQNHSYGTISQSYYGAEAMAYDQSAVANPTLLHVFSAGNIGNTAATSGIYAGITGFANFTGNFKQAKNVLTVGATDSFYIVSPLSSKGPAHDGRIKPELVAFGEDGSSGAAAMTSGAAALVQHGYKRVKGLVPASALVKAILVNSADDIGLEGLEFSSGFGSLNVYNALKGTVRENFIESTIGNGQTKTFLLNVPPGVSRLKATLVWTDPAAAVNASKALVNDLDLVIKNTSSGKTWLPWVLNTKPHKDSLLLPASTGRDTLNNIEQVLVKNPITGTYIIEVKGSALSTLSQAFAIAYQIDSTDYFEWTYPTGSDPLPAAKQTVLRWQTERSGQAMLEWSVNGTVWQTVGTIADVSIPYYKWAAPDTTTKALFRMRFPNTSYITDTTILSRPLAVHTGFHCTDSFMLYWNRLPVSQYQIYHLAGNYLQPFKVVSDSFIILNKATNSSLYYSIAPMVGGQPGIRSQTVNYTAQGVDCYLKSFYLQNQNGSTAAFVATIGTIYGIKSVSFEKFVNGKYSLITNINEPAITDFLFRDDSLTRGVNRFRIKVVLNNGQQITSDPIDVYYFTETDVIVYPNPALHGTPVHFITNKGGQLGVQVFNSTGKLIQTVKLSNQHQQLSSLSMPPGIYLLKISSIDGTVTTQKLVVY